MDRRTRIDPCHCRFPAIIDQWCKHVSSTVGATSNWKTCFKLRALDHFFDEVHTDSITASAHLEREARIYQVGCARTNRLFSWWLIVNDATRRMYWLLMTSDKFLWFLMTSDDFWFCEEIFSQVTDARQSLSGVRNSGIQAMWQSGWCHLWIKEICNSKCDCSSQLWT